MGCNSSKKIDESLKNRPPKGRSRKHRKGRDEEAANGTESDLTPPDSQRWDPHRVAEDRRRLPNCHFCHLPILDKDYNAHTVMCDEREVTCWNLWCQKIVKQRDLTTHLEECGRWQKAICPKCGLEVLVSEMQNHRDGCNPKPCPSCGEVCIIRIHKWCPKTYVDNLELKNGPFAKQSLLAKYCAEKKKKTHLERQEFNIARIQLLWHWIKCKYLVEETIFRCVYKEMDFKKEGFAIFKAHDKVNDSHVLAPRRSRSVIQAPVVAPASFSHYFPVNSNTPITLYHVQRMMQDMRRHILLPYPAAWRIFTNAMNHLNTLPNVVRMSPSVGARDVNGRFSQGCKVVVVGDIHGQLTDLLHILQECGMPGENNYYIFNGDFVDRGQYGVEVLIILFSLMLACPKYVTLNRGNHECDYMNDEYGFDVEVSTKYDRNIFRLIQRCFCALPLATIIGNKIFVVHGGLPRRMGVTIDDLSRIQRFRQVPMPNRSQPEEDEIFQDLLWSDPVEDITDWRESPRGAGVEFGVKVTNSFLETNNLKLVVRSHEECVSGYQELHDKKLFTVFSASNYDGPDTNYGAICSFIADSIDPSFQIYQVYEEDLEEQSLNITDSFAINTPIAARLASFTVNNPGSFRQILRRGTKYDILRELRERIYQRRHRLMAYFSKLDRTNKGSVWIIEWAETMRNVLNLDLPWYFLRGYLVSLDKDARTQYSPFLKDYHNILQYLWVNSWAQATCAQLQQQQRSNHRSRLVTIAFNKDVVTYNDYCSVLRAIDYTISEFQLFQLFQFFDTEGQGHLCGPAFLKQMQLIANRKLDPLRWDVDAMEQLQNTLIQGRSQLSSLFKVTSRDRVLCKEKFMDGMAQLGRGMRKQLTHPQKEAIYDFMRNLVPEHEEVTFSAFLTIVCVFNIVLPPSSSSYPNTPDMDLLQRLFSNENIYVSPYPMSPKMVKH
ncbi:unnamed protein product [Phytomonas sp. Hart1]|nr:unnamed protein product [Phytomonas sp. Hart1]|eukprot:CCW70272.1 unnamed protein product [Phytomonas sp. isolate Hart1]